MSFSGFYKGYRFRSLLELSVIRELERSGLELGTTMLYEHTRVSYGKTKVRTYVIDITIPELKLLVEVKPESKINNRTNVAKRRAAEAWCLANGWRYTMITETDLKTVGAELIKLQTIKNIEEAELAEKGHRSLQKILRQEARKKMKIKMKTRKQK